jgi:hypothetical protein
VRRLAIEFPVKALGRFGETTQFEKIKWMEVLHFLELDKEAAVIVRVEFNEPGTRMEDLVREKERRISQLELLQREKNGVCTYFMRMKTGQSSGKNRGKAVAKTGFLRTGVQRTGGYLSTPYEISEGKARATYLGDTKQLRRFLTSVDKLGVPYRVVSIEDARFPWKTPLDRLTAKQRRILVTAYRLGYYEIPKKIGVVQLAKATHLAASTLDVDLRRGERRLLATVLGET